MKRKAFVIFLLALPTAGTLLADQFVFDGRVCQATSIPKSDIIFAHANHTDLSCIDCHAGIENSVSTGDRNFPSMDVCGDCHDIEAEEDCSVCHRNPDNPSQTPHPERLLVFDHKSHIARGAECATCHGAVTEIADATLPHLPHMVQCFTCHDGVNAVDDCAVCHADHITLADIHPADWRHQHGARAALERDWCQQCHRRQESCLDCHRGDNLTGNIHDLNYLYTHGLDAKNKRIECGRCHDNQGFCNACHDAENRIPLLHSTVGWLSDHGRAARRDVESCAACHDSGDPTCARSGCHLDADGVRGTDARFHAAGMTMFDMKGPWHGDDGYFCYRCHTSTRTVGQGFCGYCHR